MGAPAIKAAATHERRDLARRVALVYVAVSSLWIVGSDVAFGVATTASILKGLAFVVVTGGLIFALILRSGLSDDERRALATREHELESAGHAAAERLGLALSATRTGVWEHDLRTNAVFWSPEVHGIMGVERFDGTLEHFHRMIHPDDLAYAVGTVRHAILARQPLSAEFRIVRPDGAVRWVANSGRAEYAGNGEAVRMLGIVHDITDRKHAEAALRQSEARFRAVLEQSVVGVYVIQDGTVVYFNPRMREIFGYSPDEPVPADPLAFVAPEARELAAAQIRERLESRAPAQYEIPALRKDGAPFALGVHAIAADYAGRPAIIAVAQDITEKARAEGEAKKYLGRLEDALQATITVVSVMGEMRDPYTHGHERRVGEIAAAIAMEMGWDATRVEGVRIAGYLHDVGKMGVPSEILVKPSRLTAAEFALVKEHAQQSYEILKNVEFPWPVAEAAWQHHERMDGSGYPRGLDNGSILEEARILAVADTVEAMASHRPYRPGLGIERALAEIADKRGLTYDAGAADACLRLFREKGYALPA